MNQVTLVMPYYLNAGMLEEQAKVMRSFKPAIRDQLSVVIVDDGSPTPAKPADFGPGVSFQLYRILEDIRWNQDAARNIGVAHAETAWVLMTDIDHLVPERTWSAVLNAKLDKGTAYTFGRVSAPEMEPYKDHPNTWLIHKDAFETVGGYDERFAGYYGTDGDFKDRVVTRLKVSKFKEPVIRYPRSHIADASTTTYLRKQPEDKPAIIAIKAKRAKDKNWQPLRGRFKYDRVA